MMLSQGQQIPLSPGPASPSFTEDLTKFPSESLHSFSFAHQSEEYLHSRQNALKRSVEFMKDRMNWMSSSNAAIASAQARVSGDVEAQNMLDLLARAQLIGAGNLPNTGLPIIGPLTGPPNISGENPFEKEFVTSPDTYKSASPTTITDASTPGGKAKDVKKPQSQSQEQTGHDSENSSRTPTNESGTTQKSSPPPSMLTMFKRTLTDINPVSLQEKLMDTMAQPFLAGQDQLTSPIGSHRSATAFPSALPAVHGLSTRWVPAAQAIFTTESKPPWTIIAANDLACLVFGVTKAEVRKMGILEVVQEERRAWLERKLLRTNGVDVAKGSPERPRISPAASAASTLLGGRSGITAQLLSKPNSRTLPSKSGGRRSQTVYNGDMEAAAARSGARHDADQSRGVILCGDVVPIQKRNGATGSASLWVKEKRVGLIWVVEEIHEDSATVTLDAEGAVQSVSGATDAIWGFDTVVPGVDVGQLIPRIPRQGIDPREGAIDFAQAAKRRYFTCPKSLNVSIPCTVERVRNKIALRVSSFPHMAGIVVVSPEDLTIKSLNAAFCGALFGWEKPDGKPISTLIPDFEKILKLLTEEDEIELVEGIVVPEHSFRKASTYLAIREGRTEAAAAFLRPEGVPAKHRDGSELRIDVQMRVVNSERPANSENAARGATEGPDTARDGDGSQPETVLTEMMYALWITYSRQLHSTKGHHGPASPSVSGVITPLHQPSPGQTNIQIPPMDLATPSGSESGRPKKTPASTASLLTKQLKEVALNAAAKLTGSPKISQKHEKSPSSVTRVAEPPRKKTIEDFVVLEDMGQGAYGQVKLARYKTTGRKVVLKYVTKRRILVDTWTRDRKLGTVPLEIHVLDYLRRPDFKHANIVEMEAFFEDETNYYIEMVPHGLPGMDLFDYIELRSNTMDENECRDIFVQVAKAVHHLHTKANVVHRDIKDENVILDGEGNIKLIDFGSAAYIKSGPFQVFVGTIGTFPDTPVTRAGSHDADKSLLQTTLPPKY
jgi:protein-serine/threonine kinase